MGNCRLAASYSARCIVGEFCTATPTTTAAPGPIYLSLGKDAPARRCLQREGAIAALPFDGENRIREEVKAARKRGVVFDIGHGRGAFTFPIARLMLDQGFKPDVISSDVHVACVDGPAFDLLMTMSKFLCLGMDIGDIIRAATAAPASVLRRPDLGTLRPGSVGDATILANYAQETLNTQMRETTGFKAGRSSS